MEAERRSWLGAALLVGLIYFLVGTLFAVPRAHVQAWWLAAWVASGIAYAAHLVYEHRAQHSSTRRAALHAALAVAIGAFALALRGMIHSLSTPAGFRPVWVLALVAWPVIAAVPAFLVALPAKLILDRLDGHARVSADPNP